MNNKELITITETARDLISKGWTQGRLHKEINGVDCYCAVGAIGAAKGGHRLAYPNWGKTLEVIENLGFISLMHLVDWNNSPVRTKEEVLEVFTKAIEKLKSEE